MPPPEQFRAPKGTQDVFAPESTRWERLLATFADTVEGAGYGLIQSPMFEDLGVFRRLGEATDVVTKEMYDFVDKGDRHIALRPEGTASVVRAFVQHHPVTPWKTWYATPAFRYESPQSGRLRQHHQVGIEVMGSADPDLDVEVIALGYDYVRRLGLRRFVLLINSMGDADDRRRYVERLRAWLTGRVDDLAPEDRPKIDTNPMRVLDSKRPATQEVVRDAPMITDDLSDEAATRFERVTSGLGALRIDFQLEPRLVRGLDYYRHTTFELQSEAIDASQSTILGGGRYDGLVEDMGGPPTPGIGFGSGIERVLLACDAEGVFPAPTSTLDVFVVDVTGGAAARDLTAELRRAGFSADRAFDARSMRAQMKAADRSGARLALIVGEQEQADGTVAVRSLLDDERSQVVVPAEKIVDHLREELAVTTAFTGEPAGLRTHWSGELRAGDAGSQVSLCGWVARRREHGEHLAFIDVRDRTGIVQCVVDGAADLRNEYVVRVTGTVRARPEGTLNAALATGEVELGDCTVEVLSTAEPPPFPLDDRRDADENVRLKYRFLDLRRERLQRNLLVRARINHALRIAMDRNGFVEIETPMLIASTPEGARDFVVPSRLSPGRFYALPQSPQLFKQLCMVGGLDRYYQIARCLRDEDLRADRQFEFMQLDMEASFVGQEEVLAFVTEAVLDAAEEVTGTRPTDMGRITWHEAIDQYGSDKPDTRFGMELVELTDVFAATEFNAFKVPSVKGIRVPGQATLGRNKLDGLTDDAKRWGAKGLVWLKVTEDGLDSPIAKFLSDAEKSGLVAAMGAQPGDLILIVAGEWDLVCHVLGPLRLALGKPPVTEGGLTFLWVVDFPLFESITDEGKPVPAHHPFTMPHLDDWDMLDSTGPDLLKVRSQAYDLTLNGWELGSGSVRIHRPDIQSRIFDLLGIEADEAQRKFGFLLDAFRYGAPPHAGFAFGVDRLAALLAGEENIREVTAFPKTQSGTDPLTGAPSDPDPAHLAELGIRVLPRST